jgi:hypothetical protein
MSRCSGSSGDNTLSDQSWDAFQLYQFACRTMDVVPFCIY